MKRLAVNLGKVVEVAKETVEKSMLEFGRMLIQVKDLKSINTVLDIECFGYSYTVTISEDQVVWGRGEMGVQKQWLQKQGKSTGGKWGGKAQVYRREKGVIEVASSGLVSLASEKKKMARRLLQSRQMTWYSWQSKMATQRGRVMMWLRMGGGTPAPTTPEGSRDPYRCRCKSQGLDVQMIAALRNETTLRDRKPLSVSREDDGRGKALRKRALTELPEVFLNGKEDKHKTAIHVAMDA